MQTEQDTVRILNFINNVSPFLVFHENHPTSYLEVLSFLHHRVKPKKYLEIGVNDGRSISLASSECELVLGVDPSCRFEPTQSNQDLVQLKSDDFFALSDLQKYGNFDMSFVDGMHLAEFALRDMINSYNLLNLGGILVIDDIVPESLVYSQRIRLAPKWSGDVYKALYIWKKCFDINITIVDCQPSCLAVIKKTISTPLKVPAISHQYLDDSSEWDKRMLSLKRHFPTVAFEKFVRDFNTSL